MAHCSKRSSSWRGTGSAAAWALRSWPAAALAAAFVVLPASPLPCRAGVTGLNEVAAGRSALLQGRADDAIAHLRTALTANGNDGEAHLLLCRVYYAEELPTEAVPECEAALTTLSGSSAAQDWMGRAYGLEADRSGPLAGFKLAIRVKTAFEAAVSLDPRNADAVDDLSEYYVGAPAILGGGVSRASALADRTQTELPQSAHRIRAYVANDEHDYATAEREFRAAVGVAGRPDAWTDLGHFYATRGETDKAAEALHHGLDADRGHDDSLVDIASIFIKIQREPGLAAEALRAYLASPNQSDAAPTFKAHVLLGKLLEAAGDKAGARAEFNRALALARDYAPAQKALRQL